MEDKKPSTSREPSLISESDPSSYAKKAPAKSNSIIVSPRQKGNPVLKLIRGIPWSFGGITPDYQFSLNTCALYLSIRYHNLNPKYLQDRLKLMGNSYDLRVLLVQVDVVDPQHTLQELGKLCIMADCTLVLAFTLDEAARYLELFKSYEDRPADLIKEKVDDSHAARLVETLTRVRKVNRTDVSALSASIGSFAAIAKSDEEALSLCPGIGPSKAQALYKVLHQPFKKERT